jgi:hypothetical protein
MSRYDGLPTIAFTRKDGTTVKLGAPRVVPEPPTKGTYQVRPGDRLDNLAQAATGDSTNWWVLADANPFQDATRLERPGTTIELPDA